MKKLKKWVNHIQWVNVLTIVAQGINNVTGAVPILQTNQYVLIAQGLLAAVLPSLNGIGHKLVYEEPQDPAHR